MESLRPLLEFAIQTAHEAGALTLGYFNRGVLPDWKADDTPVTLADREAETHIRQRIETVYPDHTIVGEEYGVADKTSHFRWFIDPIDGTKSFMRGVPLYGVLLGLEIDGRIQVGVANFPALHEIVYAASGLGCFANGRRVQVLETERLDRCVVAFSDFGNFAKYGRSTAWRRMERATWHRAGWSDAYGHALVATGRIEVMLDPVINPWDCGPFPVILREAGGFFGDWNGNESIFAGEAVSTSLRLLPQVLDVLNVRDEPQ